MQRHQMLIGGEWVDAEGGAVFESENPFQGGPWALVPRATPGDVDRAVEAAYDAFRATGWRRMSTSARGALLRRFGDIVASPSSRPATTAS
jgi:(Z)-2-((N-methylformamido)methylene)-5-hydroxybutyrolactone dehydrogenase